MTKAFIEYIQNIDRTKHTMKLKITYLLAACLILVLVSFNCYYTETEAYWINKDYVDCEKGQMGYARYEVGIDEPIPEFLKSRSDFGMYVDTTNRETNFISYHENSLRTKGNSGYGEDPDSVHKANNTNKQQVWIYNASTHDVTIQMQDWWYICILQAKTPNGKWKPIQYWRFSGCGMSYYGKPFKPKTANSFVFKIPDYGGYRTELRFKLLGKGTFHYSNTFYGSINLCDFVQNPASYSHGRIPYSPNYKLDSLIDLTDRL